MYPNYSNVYRTRPIQKPPYNSYSPNNRFIGPGFFGPFLLGGITGGLLAPSFYPRPLPPYRPYNQYGPYPTYY